MDGRAYNIKHLNQPTKWPKHTLYKGAKEGCMFDSYSCILWLDIPMTPIISGLWLIMGGTHARKWYPCIESDDLWQILQIS